MEDISSHLKYQVSCISVPRYKHLEFTANSLISAFEKILESLPEKMWITCIVGVTELKSIVYEQRAKALLMQDLYKHSVRPEHSIFSGLSGADETRYAPRLKVILHELIKQDAEENDLRRQQEEANYFINE